MLCGPSLRLLALCLGTCSGTVCVHEGPSTVVQAVKSLYEGLMYQVKVEGRLTSELESTVVAKQIVL